MNVSSIPSRPGPVGLVTTLGRVDRFWLPLEDRSVIDFFNRNLYFPHRLRERLATAARRLAALDGGVLSRTPDQTTSLDETTVRSSSRTILSDRGDSRSRVATTDHHHLELVTGVVHGFMAKLEPSATGEMTSQGIHRERWILIEDGTRTDRLIVLLFLPGHERPTVALKIAPTSAESLKRERNALVHLRATLPADLSACLPLPGILQQEGEWQVLPLSIVQGRPAYVEMQGSWQPRRSVARHLERAGHWLARFQGETGTGESFLARPAEQDAMMEWARRLEEAGVEKLSWLESLLHRCQQYPIQLCAGHGDYWARNLLLPAENRQCGELQLPGVIDWESCRLRQAPFVDLFHFVLTYGLNYLWTRYRRSEPLAALHGTFIDDNHLSRQVRHYFKRYCRDTETDSSHLRTLFELYLLRLSVGAAPDSLAWTIRSHSNQNTWLDFYRLVRHAKTTAFNT